MTGIVQIRVPGKTSGPESSPAPQTGASQSELPADAPNVYIETFGCQMNEADSSLIMGQLRQNGYRKVDGPEKADVILVNTCAVREKAEARVYGRTTQLLKHRRGNPNLVIGITGCMAEHLRDKLATTAPHVSLVAGPDSYRDIAAMVDRARTGERTVDVQLRKEETYEGLTSHTEDDGVSGFVTIQRGCDKFCTFCVVPYTRGRERGVAPREILRHVSHLADTGYKEVMLLGQTVNSYSYEDISFTQLLRTVTEIDGIERVRFTSPYPVDFTDELIATIAENPKLSPYVHMPVQSGSDAMLKHMKRGYTRDEFLTLVEKLRTAVPDIAISTDIMVGFCDETEQDQLDTLSLMKIAKFESAFMFAYSDRQVTYAARKLQDNISPELKKSRLQEVIALQEKFTVADHHSRVGVEESVLINGLSKRRDCLVGRNGRYQNVHLPLGYGQPGDLVTCRINSTSGHSLDAR